MTGWAAIDRAVEEARLRGLRLIMVSAKGRSALRDVPGLGGRAGPAPRACTIPRPPGATKHSLAAEIDGAAPLTADKPAADAAAELAEAVALFTSHTGPHAPHPAYGRCNPPGPDIHRCS